MTLIRNPSQALRIAKRYRGGILDPDDDRDRKAAVGHLIDFAEDHAQEFEAWFKVRVVR